MNEWKALTARVSLFSSVQPSLQVMSALEIYKRIWKSEPERFQKSMNPLAPSIAQGRGTSLGYACSLQSSRIDINLMPLVSDSEATESTFQVIEDPTQLYRELSMIIGEVGKSGISDSVMRVALFVQFVNLTANVVEANRAATEAIPEQYRIKLSDEEAFALQLSRPRTIRGVENIKMNFITKWSVEQFQVVTIAMPTNTMPTLGPAAGIGVPNVVEYIGASVAIDCNNIPALVPLSSAQQSTLLNEGLIYSAQMQRNYGVNIKDFGE